MKRYLFLFFTFLVIASPSFGQDKQPEMMRGTKLNEPKASIPTIIVGVNEIIGSVAEPGWPVIVSAAMLSEDESAAEFPSNLKLKVTDESDKEVPLAFEAVPQPNGKRNQLFWIASESATQGLTSGRYHVTFEPVQGIAIESGDFQVVVANPEHSASLGLLKIQKSLLLGKDDEALAEADRQVTSDAQNTDAWVAKGDILMGKDLPDEALKVYEKALEIAEKDDWEPLFIQERHRAAFFRSLEKRGVLSNTGNTP